MPISRLLNDALARFSGARATMPSRGDPVFAAFELNLSHILQQPIDSPEVRRMALASWRARHTWCAQPPESVWPAASIRQLQDTPGLIVVPPTGCLYCPACAATGSTGYQLAPGAQPMPRPFCDSPARIDCEPIAEAIAASRPIWFGWLAYIASITRGDLVQVFDPTAPRSPEAVIDDILRRAERVMRAFPGQCLADQPLWPAPFTAIGRAE